jgi:hypothetical protein
MNRRSLAFFVVAISALSAVTATATAATVPRSQVRIRDPFVLPDPATQTYFIYSSTDWGSDTERATKAVIVYRSKDLENWETPTPVFEVPEGHWGRESIWAPEVHRYDDKYYLFVTLTAKDLLPTPEGRPQNRKRGTEILVTDGPWLHRTKNGKLIMLWSSYGPTQYATGIAVSRSGKLAGPWEQQQETLWLDDGGHPMLFKTFDGRLLMTLHQPNRRVERARFFEMEDTGDTIRIQREITDFTAPTR